MDELRRFRQRLMRVALGKPELSSLNGPTSVYRKDKGGKQKQV